MAALLVAMVGCNKEPQQVEGPDVQEGKLYMQFSVNMLTTRSQTDQGGNTNSNANPDFEVGHDYENTISKVDIVLYDGTNYVVADNVIPNPASEDTFVASFSSLQLKPNTGYAIYIYANTDAPTTYNLNATSDADIDAMTSNNNFWMTNAYAAITKTLPADLSLYTHPSTPYDLGQHHVERSMARFDYKAAKANNVYTLAESNGQATVNVKLTHAALINQSKEFYLLRRVSDDGTDTDWEVGGVETPANYVVDVDWEAKNGLTSQTYNNNAIVNGFEAHMSLPTTWTWEPLTGLKDDNWDGTAATGEHELDGYQIWQYVKENTIPGIDEQLQGITTGIVFKGEISAADAASDNLKAAISAGTDPIYVFDNRLYGTWNDVVVVANSADAPATLKAAVNRITAIKDNPETTDVVEAATSADYSAAGFTVYKPEEGKYYTYYYYWNRHNDNRNNAVMSIMEFAVVRNNVYKLCVDSISRYGHPNPKDPDPVDPDPENPNEPDEEENFYFTVTVKVLPWVVRVNHIEF